MSRPYQFKQYKESVAWFKALKINSSTVEVTGAEFAALAGVTPGTVTASKGLVVDANKDLGDLRNLTIGGSLVRRDQVWQLSGPSKVGGTAGWVVGGATNLFEATLPASQTGSKLIVPIRGLKVGWTVTGFTVYAQIESAGGAVTLDADLRKLTNAAADPTDASIGAITQVAVTADTAVAANKTGLTEVIAATEWLYVEITATTAGSTDIRFLGVTLTLDEA